jgi:YD repeat-containing protein
VSATLDNPHQMARYGDTLSVDLWYPPYPGQDNPNNNTRFIEIGLVSVRAADSFRVHYDYDRDGYVVERPRRMEVLVKSDSTTDTYEERVEWIEAAFLPAWPFDQADAGNDGRNE